MAQLELDLSISPDDMLAWYRGEAKTVIARARNGQTVEFPAGALQKHVTKDGVVGRFRIVFDKNYKFVSLERCDDAPGSFESSA